MRRLLPIAAIALFLTGCSKLPGGTYCATLDGHVLNVELLADDNCIMYFTDYGKEYSGFYHIDGDEIHLIVTVNYGGYGDSHFRSYDFRSDGVGKITGGGFSVPCHESMKDKDFTCYFTRR